MSQPGETMLGPWHTVTNMFTDESKVVGAKDWGDERKGLGAQEEAPGASWWGSNQWSPEGSGSQVMLRWSWPWRQWSPWAPLSSSRCDCVFLANIAWFQNTCHITVGNKQRMFVSNVHQRPAWAESGIQQLGLASSTGSENAWGYLLLGDPGHLDSCLPRLWGGVSEEKAGA